MIGRKYQGIAKHHQTGGDYLTVRNAQLCVAEYRGLFTKPADPKKKAFALGSSQVLTDDELPEFEQENILKLLEMANWKAYGDDGTAAILQIKPTTLVSRMQKMGLVMSDK